MALARFGWDEPLDELERESGTTTKTNVDAFKLVEFMPRVGERVELEREMSTSLLGQNIDLPVVISPAGAQAIHP